MCCFTMYTFQQPVKAPTAVATVVTGQSVYHDVSMSHVITNNIHANKEREQPPDKYLCCLLPRCTEPL